jgi:hypothetical protein
MCVDLSTPAKYLPHILQAGSTTLVLSSFPNLRFLRLFLTYWVPTSTKLSRIAQLLSSIGPANVIRKITVYTEDMESTLCAEIDSKLSSLPMSHPPIVELEMYLHVYEGVWPYFPRLSSENLVCPLRFPLFLPNAWDSFAGPIRVRARRSSVKKQRKLLIPQVPMLMRTVDQQRLGTIHNSISFPPQFIRTQ